MTFPGFIDRNGEIEPVCRYVDLFPPQRPFAGFDHGIALACGGCSDMQLDGIARLISGFIQLQRHAVRACCPVPSLLSCQLYPAQKRTLLTISSGAFTSRRYEPHSTGKVTLPVSSALRLSSCSPSTRSFDRTETASLRSQTSSRSSRGARGSGAPVSRIPLFAPLASA